MPDAVAESRSDVENLTRRRLLFRWDPGFDTLLAGLSVLLMLFVFYTNALDARDGGSNPFVFLGLFVLFGNIVLNVLAPAWYVLHVRGEPISELGLTLRRWWLSLGISVGVAAMAWPELLRVSEEAQLDNPAIVRQIILNGLILWEVFFVFGWLQLRFERAFGVIPAIVLASVSSAAYHIGSLPWEVLIDIAGYGLIYAALFRITRSILTMIPIAWAFVASIGSIHGGFLASSEAIGVYFIVVVIQLSGLAWLARTSRSAP